MLVFIKVFIKPFLKIIDDDDFNCIYGQLKITNKHIRKDDITINKDLD